MLVVLWKNGLRYPPGKEGTDPESATPHVLGSQGWVKGRRGEEVVFLWFLAFFPFLRGGKIKCTLFMDLGKTRKEVNLTLKSIWSDSVRAVVRRTYEPMISQLSAPSYNIRSPKKKQWGKNKSQSVQIAKQTSRAVSVICLLGVRGIQGCTYSKGAKLDQTGSQADPRKSRKQNVLQKTSALKWHFHEVRSKKI